MASSNESKIRPRCFPKRGLIGREEKAAVMALFDKAIDSGDAFGYNGVEEEAYCREFARFMGGGYADAVNSGTTALYVALRTLDLEPFTEIIVGPITDPGGMMPIPLLNCIPVVPDTAPGCYNTGPEQIAKMITPLTSAIVVAHIAGEPADMAGIMALAKKRRIPVVEDCAQAHGATIDGRMVGTFGEVAAFSTMFGKHHCTGGQGGVVFTRCEDLYWAARRASDRGKPFGLPPGSTNSIASLNYNLNDLSATIGRIQLKKLPGIIRRRRQVVAGLARGIRGLKSVSIPVPIPGAKPSYWFLRMQFHPEAVTCDKNTLCKALSAEGLPVNSSYRHMPHTSEWFVKRRVFGASGYPWTSPSYKGNPDRQFPCPNAIEATEYQFNLQIHESWNARDVADAAATFKKVEKVFLKA
ncbi:MAG: DegT/DnrJ/EryC1/StrS family aminotransferase [Verrucomicrobia bacterium]|nr:DegT/DnrJ/EryC1/StrS family aminotransferase [Verrucomicrobiota bacterium]MCG2681897.1 DegT/DnrJ/EryC1/StrS family aminotransferase [Kiritimatiellia bacterium]MBU4246737.1 DegT/DnrJ/EryC1/StrS family aminotransferase [Verrucomicrobiota bacterium]MBU4291158.1 DegT/DnrJ/EryC1/StrS family aminotransferase [Verrucomicrobiota bacterium]MBU4429258.1 DegT/DnrJ/EryC1/StrS family aminotransferase [Verrucomicrobiota bacterium]